MQAIGYPILGDPVYGIALPEISLSRQFLHANQLGFSHPSTGEHLTFTSPLPPDLARARAQIGLPSSAVFTAIGYSGY